MDSKGIDTTGPVPARDVDETVTLLRQHVDAICAQVDRGPSLVRVSVGDISVHVEWWEGEAAPAPAVAARPAARPMALAAPVPLPVAPSPVSVAPRPEFQVSAQTVGVFYRATEPGALPFVTEGDTIRPGQQVGIIEAMKLMTPVEADMAGRVLKILVEDGAAVEYGQPLMVLDLAS